MASSSSNSNNKRPLPDDAQIPEQSVAFKKRDSDPTSNESSALQSILAGDDAAARDTTISSFFHATWQTKPRLYRRNKGANSDCPLVRAINLGWDGLASLLERSRSRFANINDDDAGPTAGTLDPPLFFRNQTPVQFPEVQSKYNSNPFAAYLDGCSAVLNHADHLCPRLAALCEDLQRSFPHCYCNGYLTPPGAQAVSAHADDRDVFVIQLLGEKIWKVYNNAPIPYPYPKEQVGKFGLGVPDEVLLGPTAIETTLRQGDVLYMPRGYVHEARTESNQPSFHATVAIATHDWTLAGNMSEMISRTLMSNKELRLAVDRRFGNPNNASRCDTASSGYDVSSLQAQIDSVMDEIRKKVTAEQIVRQLEVKYSAQRRLAGTRIALIRDETNENKCDSNAVVGPEASQRVLMETIVRAATDEERASVRPPPRPAGEATTAASDRGLTVREETSQSLMTIVQRLKQDRSLKAKVSELRSLFDHSKIDESNTYMVCALSILSFVRAAVELGVIAVVD